MEEDMGSPVRELGAGKKKQKSMLKKSKRPFEGKGDGAAEEVESHDVTLRAMDHGSPVIL